MSRDRDTIEDVLAYACAVDAISEPMYDKLAAELADLRGAAALPVVVPELAFYIPPGAERQRHQDVRNRELSAMLDFLATRGTGVLAVRHIPDVTRGAPRFSDERSRAQIAAYLAHRMPACEERNERARKRWGDHHRDAWQLTHLGTAHTKETP
jgi:hypothetical protein